MTNHDEPLTKVAKEAISRSMSYQELLRRRENAYPRLRDGLSAEFISEDSEQVRILCEEGDQQERVEKAFCWGLLCGGAVAMTVLMVTLKLLEVI